MKSRALLVALLSGLWLTVIWWAISPVAAEQEGYFITFGKDTKSLHLPVGKRRVRIKPAFEDYTFMMFDLCEAMKLWPDECMIYPMNGSLGGNTIAAIADGNRIIVYDRELSPIIGGDGAMAVIVDLSRKSSGYLIAILAIKETEHGLVSQKFRLLDSNIGHQGDRTWHHDTEWNFAGKRYV